MFAESAAKDLVRLRSVDRPTFNMINRERLLSEKLKAIGVDPEEAVNQGGRLTEGQLLKAGQTVSTEANFWSDALSLPRAFRTPQGRFFLQFKSFTQQQAGFTKRHIIDPMRRGDSGPFVRWLIGAGISGEAVADIKSTIFGTKRPTQPMLRFAENLGNSVGMGIFWDAFLTANRGQTSAWGFAAGPTVSTGMEAVSQIAQPVATGVTAGVSGDIQKAEKDFKRAGRGAGKFAVRRVLPLINRWTALAAPLVERQLFPSKFKQPIVPVDKDDEGEKEARNAERSESE